MIEVIAAGLYSSIQDNGRFGFRDSGVPVSGWMDAYSAQLANAILNNDKKAAVLEMTYQGALLKFNHSCHIAITGASCPVWLNDTLIDHNRVHSIQQNDVLKIGKVTQGVYSYLAISGGFKSEKILNSQSFYRNITAQIKLKKTDRLKFNNKSQQIINHTMVKPDEAHFSCRTISASQGPEFDQLDSNTQQTLLQHAFTVSPLSNRMAYKLSSNNKLIANEIITSCVQPGTVQLTPAGELIVLMRDCQTTGGYARILQLKPRGLNQLTQKSHGCQITFRLN